MTKFLPNPNHNGLSGYHAFKNEDGQEYGSFEVCWLNEDGIEFDEEDVGPDDNIYHAGWYWAPCFPGRMPDGEWAGPFNSSRAAYLDARNG